MSGLLSLLIVFSLLFATDGCAKSELIGKAGVAKEQCYLYDTPETYRLLDKAQKKKDIETMKRIMNSDKIEWIYKGYVVEIQAVRGDFLYVRQIRPANTKKGWLRLNDIRLN